MNKFKVVLFIVISTMISFSCSEKDPCEGVTCQNGGTCFEGNCQCPNGFEGTNCETESLPSKVNVSSIKALKLPATKSDGSKWDNDNTEPDIFPVLFTLKADKSVDQTLWVSDVIKLNAKVSDQHNFSLVLPKLSMTNFSTDLAFFMFDKDGTNQESMGGISFSLKDVVKGKPTTILLDCSTCKIAFELTVNYE